ncbi:unnamed protein product, partial [Meganyctiphanes norvegica]
SGTHPGSYPGSKPGSDSSPCSGCCGCCKNCDYINQVLRIPKPQEMVIDTLSEVKRVEEAVPNNLMNQNGLFINDAKSKSETASPLMLLFRDAATGHLDLLHQIIQRVTKK